MNSSFVAEVEKLDEQIISTVLTLYWHFPTGHTNITRVPTVLYTFHKRNQDLIYLYVVSTVTVYQPCVLYLIIQWRTKQNACGNSSQPDGTWHIRQDDRLLVR